MGLHVPLLAGPRLPALKGLAPSAKGAPLPPAGLTVISGNSEQLQGALPASMHQGGNSNNS